MLLRFLQSFATTKVLGLFPPVLCKVRRPEIVDLSLGIFHSDAPYE